MKNKKGYYIQFDNSKVDSIFAIFDETEMVKALNWETKKFEPFALNQEKEYNFLNKCVFVNEQLYKYFRKRYLDEVIPFEDTQENIYSVVFKEDGSVSDIYRIDINNNTCVLNNDGEWDIISNKTNGFQRSELIDYDTFKFIVNECFTYSPEYILKNLKYMGRNILESDFQDKDFTDALFSNGVIGFNLLPQSVRTKYPTVNHIKDFLFPKRESITLGNVVASMDLGKGYDYTVFRTWPVYKPMPSDIVKLWLDEATTLNEGLFSQLEKVSKENVVDLRERIVPSLILRFTKKDSVVEDKPKTKYQLSFPKINITGYDEVITQIGYSKLVQGEVASKLMFAINEGKHLVVRNEADEIIAFYNKEQVSKMSFKILES